MTIYSANTDDPRKLHVIVIVLGDLGRSPRMQYHALSLLQAGHDVTLIGYKGENILDELIPYTTNTTTSDDDRSNNHQKKSTDACLQVIRFAVPKPPTFVKGIAPLYFCWRIVTLTLWLFWILWTNITNASTADCVLVQNPPALPLLLVACLYCHCHGWLVHNKRPGLVIDWHNLGYSMLPGQGIVRKIAQWYEQQMAPLADGHLTVTKAMKDFVQTEMMAERPPSSNMSVLYDCPPTIFQPLSVTHQHELLLRLHSQLSTAVPQSWLERQGLSSTDTLLTEECSDGCIRPRKGRPALITSSTSWTPDEDFDLLLDALVILENHIASHAKTHPSSSTLSVLVVVTGKGPQKEYYQQKMKTLVSNGVLQAIAITTLWLEASDYPKLLACADVGISLHTSTSGLDLPMKILDLYGCQVPVCAKNFACLASEGLVQDKSNGRIFETSNELADQLWELLHPLTETTSHDGGSHACHDFGKLQTYSQALQGRTRWNDNWEEHAWPVIWKASNLLSRDEHKKSLDWSGWSQYTFALEMQAPWAAALVDGKKTIEIRAYRLPPALIGKRIWILQSPEGKAGVSSSGNVLTLPDEQFQIIGWCTFSAIKTYTSKMAFEADEKYHLVDTESGYAWKEKVTKEIYGWEVSESKRMNEMKAASAVRRLRSLFQLYKNSKNQKKE